MKAVSVKLVGSILNVDRNSFFIHDDLLYYIGARVLLFIAFLLAFGAVIGGAWVLFGYYIPYKKDKLYPGVAIFVQNLAIFIRFV